jgi:hypothetical protein
VEGFEQKSYLLDDTTREFDITEQDGIFEVLPSVAAGPGRGRLKIAELGTALENCRF